MGLAAKNKGLSINFDRIKKIQYVIQSMKIDQLGWVNFSKSNVTSCNGCSPHICIYIKLSNFSLSATDDWFLKVFSLRMIFFALTQGLLVLHWNGL